MKNALTGVSRIYDYLRCNTITGIVSRRIENVT